MQKGGGILVAVGLLGGAIVGQQFGESSIGIIAGLVLGLVGAAILAVWDSRRKR